MTELSSKLRERRARIGEGEAEGHDGRKIVCPRKDSLVYLASKQIVTLRRWRRKSSQKVSKKLSEKQIEALEKQNPGVEGDLEGVEGLEGKGLEGVEGHSGTDGELSDATSEEEGDDDEELEEETPMEGSEVDSEEERRKAEDLQEPLVETASAGTHVATGEQFTLALNGQPLAETTRDNGTEEPVTEQLNGEPPAKTTGSTAQAVMEPASSEKQTEMMGSAVQAAVEPASSERQTEVTGSAAQAAVEPASSERQTEVTGSAAQPVAEPSSSERQTEATGPMVQTEATGSTLASTLEPDFSERQSEATGPATPSTLNPASNEKQIEATRGLSAQKASEPACLRQTETTGPAAELAPEVDGQRLLHAAGVLSPLRSPADSEQPFQVAESEAAARQSLSSRRATRSTSGPSEQTPTKRLFDFFFGISGCCTLRERTPPPEAAVISAQPCEESPSRRGGTAGAVAGGSTPKFNRADWEMNY